MSEPDRTAEKAAIHEAEEHIARQLILVAKLLATGRRDEANKAREELTAMAEALAAARQLQQARRQSMTPKSPGESSLAQQRRRWRITN